MVDEAGQISAFGGVNDVLEIYAEQIGGADAHRFVLGFSQIGQYRSDNLADVFDHHLVGGNRLQGEETPVVDRRLAKFELCASELQIQKVSTVNISHLPHSTLTDGVMSRNRTLS